MVEQESKRSPEQEGKRLKYFTEKDLEKLKDVTDWLTAHKYPWDFDAENEVDATLKVKSHDDDGGLTQVTMEFIVTTLDYALYRVKYSMDWFVFMLWYTERVGA